MLSAGTSFLCVRWQLPTYDGAKSYQNLLVEVYGAISGDLEDSNIDAYIQNKPINFIRSGRYQYDSGIISNRSARGYYWQSGASSWTYANYLNFYPTLLNSQNGYGKSYGYSLRCLVR